EAGGCGTQFVKISKNGKERFQSTLPKNSDQIVEALPETFSFCCASVMIKREVYDDLGGFNSYFNGVNDEDHYWVALISLKHGLNNIDRHLYYYRYNPTSLTKNIKNINPKRKYVHHITKFLIGQQKIRGTNDLTEENFEEIRRIENSCHEQYDSDPSFIYRDFANQYVYWNDHKNAFKASLTAFDRRSSFLNMKYCISSLIKMITHWKI
ncbi:MAG: hypothetical protein ACI8Q1_002480, partial [Parvicella sp.]